MSNHEELVIRALELTDRQDWAGREALMTPDVEFVMPGATLQGPAATTAYSKPMIGAFPDSKHVVDVATGAGDLVFVEGAWVGTNLGPLATPGGDVPPTGRPVNMPFSCVARVRDGRIASLHVYFDQLGFLGQLGLVPQPQAA